MKKKLGLFLSFALSLSAAAGMTAFAESAPLADTQELTFVLSNEPDGIDPTVTNNSFAVPFLANCFEGLVTYDSDGGIVPGNAESWDINDDLTVFTFHLRDGLKWSDGSDLTAQDYVYTALRVLTPATTAQYLNMYTDYIVGAQEYYDGTGSAEDVGVKALDDQTLEYTLKAPCPYFIDLVSMWVFDPVQQATIEANGDAWAIDPATYVSNGPFMITEWVPSSYIITEKNPNYWNADAIKLDSIKWNLIEDSNAAYSAYQNGDVLFIKDVPTEEIPSLQGNEEFYVDPIIGTYYISLNTQVEPLTDPLVRKALSLAIDRDYVANTLMQGTYSPAVNFMGPGWKDTDGSDFMTNANGGEPYLSATADVEGALAALEEAGYPNGEGLPVLHYITNDAGYHKAVAEYLQDAWKEIGVTLEVEIMEWASFTPTRRNGEYEIARNGWVGDYSDPSNMLELMYSTNGNNDGKFNNADFDAAIDVSRSTTDPEERSAALHEAEDIMMAETSCIPVAYYNDFWMQSPKITGAWHSAYGYWYFMYADIEE